MSLKILIITNENIISPCFRLRLGYFLDYLKKQKRVDYYVNDLSHYSVSDIIIIQRNATFTPELLRLMINNPKPVIYETDDFFQQLPLHTHSRSLRSSITLKLRLLGSWNATFITSTPYLADKLSVYSEDVNVIYNTSRYVSYKVQPATTTGTCLVSFIGTATHSRDFVIIGNALERIAEKYRHVRYLFMGDRPRNLQENIPMDYCPFSDDYQKAMSRFRSYRPDIGIAPLLDTQFNRAKSAIKYIDYTYAGAVGIYSNIVPYRGIIGGILVKNHQDQWYEGICRLIENPELRIQLYKKAVDDIKDRFSFNVESERFFDILERVACTKALPSKARKETVIRLAIHARDSGQTVEFLEYVRLFYPVYLKDHITVQDVFDAVDKTDYKSFSINLVAEAITATGSIEKRNALCKSWTNAFITQPYFRIRNIELEMYQFASKERTKGSVANALIIFKRILQKSSEPAVRAGAAFHLGEIALRSSDHSKAIKCFTECTALNPEHSKAKRYLRKLTR